MSFRGGDFSTGTTGNFQPELTKVQPGCTTCARFGPVSECCAQRMILANRPNSNTSGDWQISPSSSTLGAISHQERLPLQAGSALVFWGI